MFVIDASALAKAFLEEERSQEFRDWIDGQQVARAALWAPHIAYSEVGRIIQKGLRGIRQEAAQAIHEATFLGVEIVGLPDTDLDVWEVAQALSYYDAEYVDAARQMGATLVSADRRQLKEAARIRLKTISFAAPSGKRAKRT